MNRPALERLRERWTRERADVPPPPTPAYDAAAVKIAAAYAANQLLMLLDALLAPDAPARQMYECDRCGRIGQPGEIQAIVGPMTEHQLRVRCARCIRPPETAYFGGGLAVLPDPLANWSA